MTPTAGSHDKETGALRTILVPVMGTDDLYSLEHPKER